MFLLRVSPPKIRPNGRKNIFFDLMEYFMFFINLDSRQVYGSNIVP